MSIQAPSFHSIANVAPAPAESGTVSSPLTGAGDWRLGFNATAGAPSERTMRIAGGVIGHSTLQQAAESAMAALNARRA